MTVLLSEKMQSLVVDLFKCMQETKETKDLVVVISTEQAALKALEASQLGYVESNVVMHFEPQDGQLVVFTTDGTDPAIQPYGTNAPPRVSVVNKK